MLSIEKLYIGTRSEISLYLKREYFEYVDTVCRDNIHHIEKVVQWDALDETNISLEKQLRAIEDNTHGEILYWDCTAYNSIFSSNKKSFAITLKHYHVFVTENKNISIDGTTFLDEINYN